MQWNSSDRVTLSPNRSQQFSTPESRKEPQGTPPREAPASVGAGVGEALQPETEKSEKAEQKSSPGAASVKESEKSGKSEPRDSPGGVSAKELVNVIETVTRGFKTSMDLVASTS